MGDIKKVANRNQGSHQQKLRDKSTVRPIQAAAIANLFHKTPQLTPLAYLIPLGHLCMTYIHFS
jgi:hypothetical protein